MPSRMSFSIDSAIRLSIPIEWMPYEPASHVVAASDNALRELGKSHLSRLAASLRIANDRRHAAGSMLPLLSILARTSPSID